MKLIMADTCVSLTKLKVILGLQFDNPNLFVTKTIFIYTNNDNSCPVGSIYYNAENFKYDLSFSYKKVSINAENLSSYDLIDYISFILGKFEND